jgi:anti-sigma B factor antagonist
VIGSIRQVDDVTIVALSDRLDAATSPQIRARLHELINEGQVRLVLNLRDVIFLDSSGLGLMVSCLRRCVAGGGDLCLSQVPEFAQGILELTRLTRVFRIAGTDDEGVQSVRRDTQ